MRESERPAIGARVYLRGGQPWAGYSGVVVAWTRVWGEAACEVQLDDEGAVRNHCVGLIERTDFALDKRRARR